MNLFNVYFLEELISRSRHLTSFISPQLWRVSQSVFQFRTSGGKFLTCEDGGTVSATAESPSDTETFYLERNINNRVHIRLKSGTYLQV